MQHLSHENNICHMRTQILVTDKVHKIKDMIIFSATHGEITGYNTTRRVQT